MSNSAPVAPAAPNLAGLLLDGRYELQTIVGEGTFGHVYRGFDRRLERIVAVKLIKPWWASEPSWVQAFEREARLLARVSDSGIVQIYDVGRPPAGLYYVTEFVDGESLAGRLRRGPLDPWDAHEIAEQLCRALGRAHAAQIVHRDIKPANVLLSSIGQVKLGDFGVARLAEEGTDWSSGMMVAGTPRYMAPEHARGLRTTPASDTYSVGVVLYEMLAGVPPFTGTAPVELALSHLQEEPPPLPPRVPDELASVVMRALAKQPEDRYEDGRSMADALRQARRAADTRRRVAPTVARGRSSAPEPPRADATRPAPKRTRRNFNPAERRRTIATIGAALVLLAAMGIGALLLAAPDRVRVPRMQGLSRAAALAEARHIGLHPLFSVRYAQAAKGTVIAQTPVAGRRADKGSTVRLVLSGGPPPVELPKLVGQSTSSARSILRSLGLTAKLATVPAPGVQPGTVTAQSPAAGKYVQAHGAITLDVAETPNWRPLTSFAGTDSGQSVPFRIRGTQFRLVYRMGYVGTCTFIFFCDGPSAQVTRTGERSTADSFGLNSGTGQVHVVKAGAGVYEIRIKPGMDTARWSIEVDDYF